METKTKEADGKEPSETHSDSKTPMAFTIDFGNGETESKKGFNLPKKFSLKEGINSFAPTKRPVTKAKTSPNVTASTAATATPLDKENNNNHVQAAKKEDNVDQLSDAGTYTIDEDEENDKEAKEYPDAPLDIPKYEAQEYVAQWAASSNYCSSESPSSSIEPRDDTSRSRRRLPTVPRPPSNGANDTETLLQDTISVMAAMEARLDESKSKAAKSTTKVPPKPNPQEERKINWERRKNYDPLKAVGKSRPSSAKNSPRGPYVDESFSEDTCSEIEQHSLPITESSASTRSKCLPSTRPNRAFALRKKLNSSNESPSGTPTNPNLSRGDGGRFSLRGTKTPASTTRPVSVNKPHLLRAHDTRSSSSLSSKEAEFQAWKRRKNYNPMASSRSAQVSKVASSTASPVSAAMASSMTEKVHLQPRSNQQPRISLNGTSVDPETPMQRSASFHYPDGMSRIQHHVYSSEDDEDFNSLRHERSDVFDINDDEFILPIGASVRTRPVRSSGSSGSSGHKMEALDNLVISTIFSISTKLCLNSASIIRRAQDRAVNQEQHSMMDTLLYVLEDTDPPPSPSKKTSRELAGTLRNLKKVEQALQVFESACLDDDVDDTVYEDDDVDADDENK